MKSKKQNKIDNCNKKYSSLSRELENNKDKEFIIDVDVMSFMNTNFILHNWNPILENIKKELEYNINKVKNNSWFDIMERKLIEDDITAEKPINSSDLYIFFSDMCDEFRKRFLK